MYEFTNGKSCGKAAENCGKLQKCCGKAAEKLRKTMEKCGKASEKLRLFYSFIQINEENAVDKNDKAQGAKK